MLRSIANMFQIFEVRQIDGMRRPITRLLEIPGSSDILATASDASTTQVCCRVISLILSCDHRTKCTDFSPFTVMGEGEIIVVCEINSPVPSCKLCFVTTSFRRPFCSPPVFKNCSRIMADVWIHRDGEWCPGVWCVCGGGGGGKGEGVLCKQ